MCNEVFQKQNSGIGYEHMHVQNVQHLLYVLYHSSYMSSVTRM